mmetsp:Transcript_10786/g.17108  ORF Transcript_10786/g.17108 Transcript_10786/m.17108 type:complete len:528 (-) Transcript_10786:1403-2986(-)
MGCVSSSPLDGNVKESETATKDAVKNVDGATDTLATNGVQAIKDTTETALNEVVQKGKDTSEAALKEEVQNVKDTSEAALKEEVQKVKDSSDMAAKVLVSGETAPDHDTCDDKAKETRIVILGTGFFGIAAARELSDLVDDEKANVKVTIVDQGKALLIGGELQYVLTGRKEMDELWCPYSDLRISPKIEKVFETEIIGLDPTEKNVLVKPVNGGDDDKYSIEYDYALCCLGVVSCPEIIPGLTESGMFNICDRMRTVELAKTINSCKSGDTILFNICRMPYKCPPVPFEYLMLIDEMLIKRGIRESCKLILTCPKAPFPFGSELSKTVFLDACKDKGIEFIAGFQPQKYRPEDNVVELESTTGGEEVKEIHYDILLGVYPQRAPPVLKSICNKKGFVDADVLTTETKHPGLFCVGDCSWMMLPHDPPKPHPKAGGFAFAVTRNSAMMISQLARGVSKDEAAASLPEGREAECYAESGCETGILIGAKLLKDSNGPPDFRCEGPAKVWYDKKEAWLADVKHQFFNSH